MEIFESIFNKKVSELTQNDILGRKENEMLEFKGGDNLVQIAETACAFANTTGGVILLGVQEGINEAKNTAKEINGYKEFDPKRIQQSLSSSIGKPIQGVSFDEKAIDGKKIGVIEIPMSYNAPHSLSGKFFIRIGEEDKPAPVGLVESMFNRRPKHANLELIFNSKSGDEILNLNIDSRIKIYCKNTGKYSPSNLMVHLSCDVSQGVGNEMERYCTIELRPEKFIEYTRYTDLWGSVIIFIFALKRPYSIPQGLELYLGFLEINRKRDAIGPLRIKYGLFADNMKPVDGEKLFKLIW